MSNSFLEAALEYAANGFAVLPLDGKRPHPRLGMGGWKRATTDSETIRKWWGGEFTGCNIGIVTGEPSGFFVLDVDVKDGVDGMTSLAELERRFGSLPTAPFQITGSGGRHYLFRCDGTPIRNKVGKLGPGLDVRGDGGLIVVAPSIHPDTGKSYEWANGRAPTLDEIPYSPEWFMKRVEAEPEVPAFVPPSNTVSHAVPPQYGRKVLDSECSAVRAASNGTQRQTLNDAALKIGRLIPGGYMEFGTARSELISAGLSMPNFDNHRRWTRADIEKTVDGGLRDGMKMPRIVEPKPTRIDRPESAGDLTGDWDEQRGHTPPEIAELNRKHAVVKVGNKVMVSDVQIGPDGYERTNFITFEQLKNLYCHRKILVNGTLKSLGSAWLTHPHRRQYERVAFEPSGVALPDCMNLWKGFAVTPREGKCQLFLGHIYENISNGDEEIYKYVLDFMADAVQNPSVRPGVALVLRGKRGTGKTVLVEHFKSLFGGHVVTAHSSHEFLGTFNGRLENALLVVAEEAMWAGEKALESKLKALITDKTITIERKGIDSYAVKNCVRLIMTSNYDWVVPAGEAERRFSVLDVGDAHIQDSAYFAAIEREMDEGGREALLDFLMKRDLKDANLRRAPKTKALEEQKLMSLEPVERWWLTRLHEGYIIDAVPWQQPVTAGALFRQFQDSAPAENKRWMDQMQFILRLRKLVPEGLQKKRSTLPNRPYVYALPPLKACRERFDDQKGLRTDWGPPSEEEADEGEGATSNLSNLFAKK